MRRVSESVREVVAEGIRGLKDPRIGMVTVTGVEVTRRKGDAHALAEMQGALDLLG